MSKEEKEEEEEEIEEVGEEEDCQRTSDSLTVAAR